MYTVIAQAMVVVDGGPSIHAASRLLPSDIGNIRSLVPMQRADTNGNALSRARTRISNIDAWL